MAEEHSRFHNEDEREVHLSVSETDHPGILVQMADQFSQVEHLYSRAEALELYRVLGNVLYPRGSRPLNPNRTEDKPNE